LDKTVLLEVQNDLYEEAREAQPLDELLADPEIGSLLRRVAPSEPGALARVRAEDVDHIRALLTERGIDITDKLR
jgi:hypothetical protein